MPAIDLRRAARGYPAGDDARTRGADPSRVKARPAADDHQREMVQKTLLGSLNRAKETIERVEIAGVVSWRPL
jgi:hypothetical protein